MHFAMEPGFSLEGFERSAWSGDCAAATDALIAGLAQLEAGQGRFGETAALAATAMSDLDGHLATRFAAAASAVLASASFGPDPAQAERLLALKPWLQSVFAASAFGNSDHVLRALLVDGQVPANRLSAYCAAWTPDSLLPLDPGKLHRADPALALSLVLAALAPRVCLSEAADARREAWLPWLAERLGELQTLEGLPLALLHQVAMNASYARRADKHAVKGAIGGLIRRTLARHGLTDNPRALTGAEGRPVMLVLLEQFLPGHAIWRTHSRATEALRGRFHTIAAGLPQWVPPESRAIFDEFVAIEPAPLAEQLRALRRLSDARDVQILFAPSVGMMPLTLFAAALRLAPLQAMGTGHPATTGSPAMDFAAMEGDFLGDPACWSETVLALPGDALPYRPPEVPAAAERGEGGAVRIAVCGSVMKLGPRFLAMLARVRERAARRIEFHFLPALAEGVTYWQVRREIEVQLGGAVAVYPHQPPGEYSRLLGQCDLFASPFPFGNTNGLVDCIVAGLPGVCRTGPEVHERIDGALLARAGFPDWTIAADDEAYLAACVRLIDDASLRGEIAARCCGPAGANVFFTGRPEALGDALHEEWQRRISG